NRNKARISEQESVTQAFMRAVTLAQQQRAAEPRVLLEKIQELLDRPATVRIEHSRSTNTYTVGRVPAPSPSHSPSPSPSPKPNPSPSPSESCIPKDPPHICP